MIEMTALPKVSATETADLRDVHKRLAKQFWYIWVYKLFELGSKIYPRWF